MNENPSGHLPDLDQAASRYQNYLQLLAEFHLGQWIRGRVSASDIVQETLLDATRDHGKFRGATEEQYFAWLKTILLNNVNAAIDIHGHAQKRSVRREVSIQRLHDLNQSSAAIENILAAQTASPSQSACRHELVMVVADCLSELDEVYREVVMLRTLQGKKYDEISEILGRSGSACRMLWVRAITRLRQKFAERNLL